MADKVYSRVLGCMVGNALGDSWGAVVEGATAERVATRTGGRDWFDEFLPFPDDFRSHPLGVWDPAPPRGTGTDDTRYNQILVECVIRNGGLINSQFLAIEYIERYRDRARFYPGHEAMAEQQYRWLYEAGCAHLGMKELPSGLAPYAVAGQGIGIPSLHTIISLGLAGLLYKGEPEKAYAKAVELAFVEIGYGRTLTGMMAAMISAAIGGGISGREMVRIGLETDPFTAGEKGQFPNPLWFFNYGRRISVERMRKLIEAADKAKSDRELVEAASREIAGLHIWDPIDVLGVPMAAVYYSDGDPIRSIVMAINDREFDAEGKFKRLRDVDCTGGIAGALVGALHGVEAFPKDWVAEVIAANRKVNHVDLEANARQLCETLYPGG
ncbi:MAG: ADP-ribosylglycohydrolase family protein [Armatimonadota bacterium]